MDTGGVCATPELPMPLLLWPADSWIMQLQVLSCVTTKDTATFNGAHDLALLFLKCSSSCVYCVILQVSSILLETLMM